ncbi:MAG: hypothetical protein ABWZ77_06395 [Naasia sp.]
MSSAPATGSTSTVDVLRTRGAEIAYNTVLAVLSGAAVLLFILGGTSASFQGLWAVAVTAVAAIVLLFTAHRILTRER